MKTLFLEKDSFVRIKNLNNKLVMFYSKFDKTAIAIINHKTLEMENDVELSIDVTIADLLYLNNNYYAICYDIHNQTICRIIVLNDDLKIVDIIDFEIFLGSTYYGTSYNNKELDLYFSNKSVAGRSTNNFKSNLSITCYYDDQALKSKDDVVERDDVIRGSLQTDEHYILLTKKEIITQDINTLEEVSRENIISPVATEQMVLIEDDIICLIVEDSQYVLVNQVVQKI